MPLPKRYILPESSSTEKWNTISESIDVSSCAIDRDGQPLPPRLSEKTSQN